MAETNRDPMAGEQSAAERAPEQQIEQWPSPGEEGYVHPDGTPQAERQLTENKQAAADRAAAGSVVHGAPVATNDVLGPGVAAGIAEKRAEDYAGPTEAERRESVTDYVTEESERMADEQAEQRAAADRAAAGTDRAATPKPAASRGTTDAKPSGETQQKR